MITLLKPTLKARLKGVDQCQSVNPYVHLFYQFHSVNPWNFNKSNKLDFDFQLSVFVSHFLPHPDLSPPKHMIHTELP